jgi:hypothetical protein
MSQRVVPLTATLGTGGKLTITAPAAPELAPPSYYMLFVLSTDGVPSVAKFVRLKFGSPSGPPNTEITSGPPAATQSTAARFEFRSGEQGATFRCRLDAGAPAPCSSPWDYAGLAPGPHALEVTAVDPAGTPDPSPATWSWTVNPALPDVTPPETTITYGPVSTYATTARFEFQTNEPGSSFACRLDSGPWSACASPSDFGGLTLGAHSFAVRATDPAGNVDPSAATWTWRVLDPPAAATNLAAPPGVAGFTDTSAPRLRMRLRQVRGRIVVEVTCRNEACVARAGGRVTVPGAARTFKLRSASAQLQRGIKRKLRLRFSKQASRRVRRALRKRLRVRARVLLTANDAAGNAATSRRSVRLRG